MCLKANSVDSDQMIQYVASDLGLLCLLRLFCPKAYDYYSRFSCELCFLGSAVLSCHVIKPLSDALGRLEILVTFLGHLHFSFLL